MSTKKTIFKFFNLFLSFLLLQSVIFGSCNAANADTTIVSLVNTYQYDYAFQNMPYSLPQSATANMSDGSRAEVPVTWSPSTVDLTKTGYFTYTGKVAGTSQTVTLQLAVHPPIESIDSKIDTVYQGDSYTLPKTTMVRLSDNMNLGYFDIVWSPSTVDTSVPGVYTYEGTIRNYTGKASLTLTVKAKSTIASIDNITVDLQQNQSYSLPQTVSALMSDGSRVYAPITWDSTSVDTGKTGTFKYNGTVQGYSSQVGLTLVISPVFTPVQKFNISVNQFDSYSLPKSIPAFTSTGSRKDVPVSWNPSSADTSKAGTYTFTGSVQGFSSPASLTLVVNPAAITSVDNINVKITQNEPFSLPQSISALLSNGTNMNVPVTWNPSTVDTGKAGTYTFTGTVQGYSRPVTLTLVVSPVIASIQNINATVNENDSYSLPKSLPALMSDGTYKDVPVSWYPSTVDTGRAGICNYSGTIQGYTGKVTLALTVKPVVKTIENISATVSKNSSYSLPQTVSALMSDGTHKDFPVTWDSNLVDTSILGTSTFTGTVQGYSNKVILTLLVKEKLDFLSVSFPYQSVDVFQDTPYNLPQTATAYLSDRTFIDVPVSWSPSTVDLSKTGSFDFVGTVEGWDKKLTITVNVYDPIVSVYNPPDSVYQNDPYNFPQAVSVVLKNGKGLLAQIVRWSPSTADTSRVGVFTYEGTIINSTAKTYLTLTVKSKISFKDISMSVNQNQSFSFPKTVTAFSIDGTSKEVPVTWNATSVDTSICGTQTFEGTVEGYDGKVKLSLYVRGPGMVYFPDSNLEAAIRDAISKPTGDITENDMLKIKSLNINSNNLNNIEGIQYAKNLTSLSIANSSVEDISQLAGLTQLNSLSLSANKIKSISSLSNLINLASLSLSDNMITDISPLSNLSKLTSIDLTRNKVNDISALRNLTNLERLNMGQCNIADISALSGLTKLSSLIMNYNYISDISPLIGLSNLTKLDLSDDLIEDFTALVNLSSLTELNLSGNHLRDFSKYTLFNDNIKIDFWGLSQTKAEIAAFLSKADEIIASVTTPGMTPYEIEKALHDYICTNTVYTLGINQGAYGILILGKGTCDAYSDAMNLLLNRAGIYCIKIHGYFGTKPHAWNIVMIDGKYYQLDVTWDTCFTNEDGILCTKYLNVNDAFMLTERTWDTSKYPACN